MPAPEKFQNKTTERPTSSPYSHHVATEREEEFTPFCTAASSNGALPTPSGLSQHYSLLSVTWDEKQRAHRRCTHYERSYTGTDHVVLRRRRSSLCAAFQNWAEDLPMGAGVGPPEGSDASRDRCNVTL